jgi:hypothetical protein
VKSFALVHEEVPEIRECIWVNDLTIPAIYQHFQSGIFFLGPIINLRQYLLAIPLAVAVSAVYFGWLHPIG